MTESTASKAFNWALTGAGAVLVVVLLAYIEWRVAVNTRAELAKQDIASDAKIVSMDDNIQANAHGVADNKEENEITRRQLEAMAQVLMERPEPDR